MNNSKQHSTVVTSDINEVMHIFNDNFVNMGHDVDRLYDAADHNQKCWEHQIKFNKYARSSMGRLWLTVVTVAIFVAFLNDWCNKYIAKHEARLAELEAEIAGLKEKLGK